MSSLLQRARALISGKPTILGALVIVPLASAARTADAVALPTPYFFSSAGSSAYLLLSGSGTHTPEGSVGANPVGNTLELFSSPINISATTYNNLGALSLDLVWTGSLDNSFFPVNASTIQINYDFIVGLTGTTPGSVAWTLHDNIGGQTLNTLGTSTGSEPIGSLSAPVTSALTGTWSSELDIVWSGFSNDAQMSVHVPGGSSIDLSVGAPEPASLSLLGLGAIGLLARRRRKD